MVRKHSGFRYTQAIWQHLSQKVNDGLTYTWSENLQDLGILQQIWQHLSFIYLFNAGPKPRQVGGFFLGIALLAQMLPNLLEHT